MSLDARMVDVKAELVNRRHELLEDSKAVLEQVREKYDLTAGEMLSLAGLVTWIGFTTVMEETSEG